MPTISRELHELERLAFVPPGRCVLIGYEAPLNEFSIDRPMLIDRFEATIGDWHHYFAALGERERPEGARETWPVALSLEEARRLAAARGMRLLTAREWIFCAAGTRGHPFPWGPSPQSSLANTLELGLGRPAAVGTFENGVGPFGCYDLFGNLWEWVSDRVPGRGETSIRAEDSVSVMGGSWCYRLVPLYGLPDWGSSRVPVFNALTVDAKTESDDIGVRLGADARDYLWKKSAHWGTSADARRRLLAVGRRFGSEAGPLLKELAERAGAARGLGWLAEGASR